MAPWFKALGCSPREPEFNYQQLLVGSQSSLIGPDPFVCCARRQNIHIHKIHKEISLKNVNMKRKLERSYKCSGGVVFRSKGQTYLYPRDNRHCNSTSLLKSFWGQDDHCGHYHTFTNTFSSLYKPSPVQTNLKLSLWMLPLKLLRNPFNSWSLI